MEFRFGHMCEYINEFSVNHTCIYSDSRFVALVDEITFFRPLSCVYDNTLNVPMSL